MTALVIGSIVIGMVGIFAEPVMYFHERRK